MKNITVKFEDGTTHTYQNVPDDVTPDSVEQRATKESGKKVVSLDGGRQPQVQPQPQLQPQPPEEPSFGGMMRDSAIGAANVYKNLGGGLLNTGAHMGATVRRILPNALGGDTEEESAQRRADIDQGMKDKYDTHSGAFLAGEVMGGFGAGMGAAKGFGMAVSGRLERLSRTLASKAKRAFETGGGVSLGGKTLTEKSGNAALRIGAGTAAGAGGAGIIHPEDTGLGATLGGVLPVVGGAIGAIRKIALSGTKNSMDESAARLIREQNSEASLDVVRNAIDANVPIAAGGHESVADIIAKANMGKNTAHGKSLVATQDSLERIPDMVAEASDTLKNTQASARAAQVQSIAKDESAVAALEHKLKTTGWGGMKTELDAATIAGKKLPKFDDKLNVLHKDALTALQNSWKSAVVENEAAVTARKLSKNQGWTAREAIDNQKTIQSDMNNVKGALYDKHKKLMEHGDFVYRQAMSLAEHGLKPLKSNAITNVIDDILRTPGSGRSEGFNDPILNEIRGRIVKYTNKNGTINAHDLHGIRKTLEDIAIKHTPEKSTGEYTAKLVRSLKSKIDDAIIDAGGDDWKKALEYQSGLFRQLDELKTGKEMLQKLKGVAGGEDQVGFSKGLQQLKDSNNKHTGESEFSRLSPESQKKLDNVHQEILRDAQRKRLGKNINQSDVLQTAEKSKGGVVVPPTLTREGMIIRFVISRIYNGADEKLMKRMGMMMIDDPKLFRQTYLSKIPKSEQKELMSKVLEYRAGMLGATTQATKKKDE